MSQKIQVRRGNKADLPTLDSGEPGLVIDQKEFYVGTPAGNLEVITKPKFDDLAGAGRTTQTVKKNADDLAGHLPESASKHIKESGSNANGSYIKFDDGTLICTASIDFATNTIAIDKSQNNGYYSSAIPINFPAIFISAPSVVAMPRTISGLYGATAHVYVISTSSWSMILTCNSSITFNSYVYYIAIGRWK